MTPAGVLNALWMFMTFLLVSAIGLADLYQAAVRTVNDEYESGLPSFIWVLLVYGGLNLACVVTVGLLTRRP
jgi:hypothetical protein